MASWPFSQALRRERAALTIPSRQMTSVNGEGELQTNGSMSCVSASRPVNAVTDGGRLYVSRGSTTAMRGNMYGLRRLTLMRFSGKVMTALRVTSEPVPAVVGWQ